jgi:DNA-binding NtrC family response regulator
VLVVDDDEGLARFVVEVLADAGHHAEAAPSAAAARRRVEAGDFDVVVTDLRMPGESGLDLIAWLRKYDPRIAVLAVTAFGSLETAVQAIRLGAADYIPKPFEPSALLLAVDKSLRAHAMRSEIERLRGEVQARYGFDAIVARSAVMQELVAFARRIADSPSAALLHGPPGVGKELMARAIHHASRRRARPFEVVNCSATPDHALEAELFGRPAGRGADAVEPAAGALVAADGGTVLLDEVGDLPMGAQRRLVRHFAGPSADVRIIATSQRDLRAAVAAKTFSEDLFYRLSVLEMGIPALADRADDVLPLAEHFLRATSARLGRPVRGFSAAASHLVSGYGWPGNVRELQSAVERGANVCAGDEVTPDDLPPTLRRPRGHDFLDEAAARGMTVSELEVAFARRVLAKNGGNKKKTARLLGIDRRTLYRWLGESEPAEPEDG